MGLARYSTEIAVKAELKDLLSWIAERNLGSSAEDLLRDTITEIVRRIREPTEG